MGLRKDIPTPSPANLESPVPLQNQPPEDISGLAPIDIVGGEEPLPAPEPVAEEVAPEPEPERAPAAEELPELEITPDDIADILINNPEISSEELDELLTVLDPVKAVKLSFQQKLKERFAAGLPIDMTKRVAALKKKVEKGTEIKIGRFEESEGDPSDPTSIVERGEFTEDPEGEIHVKRPGEKEFSPFDPSELGLEEAGLDIADLGGDLFEGIITGLTEAGIIGAGAAGTAGLGAIPATAAALATGPVVGLGARQGLSQLVTGEDVVEEENALSELGTSVGLNFLAFGGQKIAGRVLDLVGDFFQSGPKTVAKNVVEVQKFTEDTIKKIGVSAEPVEAGAKFAGALDKIRNDFGGEVQLLKDKVSRRTTGEVFPAENYMNSVRKSLEENGATLDEFGFATLPKSQSKAIRAIREGDSVGPLVETKAARAGQEGKAALSRLVNDYNDNVALIKQNGGLSFDKIDEITGSLQARPEITDATAKQRVNNMLTGIENSAKDDRDLIMTGVMQGGSDTERELALSAMDTYSENIASLQAAKKIFKQSSEENELFVKAMTRPNNIKTLKETKALLGEGSKEWRNFKASWLDDTMSKNIDSRTNVFDANKFLKEIDSDRSVRKVMLDDPEFRDLAIASRKFSKIDFSKVDFKPQEKQAMTSFVGAMSGFVGAKIRGATDFLFNLGSAADYLVKDGFVDMAKAAATESEKMFWIKRRNLYREIINTSQRVQNKNGSFKYILTPASRTLLRRTAKDELAPNEPQQEVNPELPGL